jgi:hypothetical protein
MRCKILRFHGGDCEECRSYLTGYTLHLCYRVQPVNVMIDFRFSLRLLVTANATSSSRIFNTLKMEASRSSETSVIIPATWRQIPEDETLLHYLPVDSQVSQVFSSFQISV